MITRAIAITKHAHNKYLINPPKKKNHLPLVYMDILINNNKCFLHFQAIYSQNENAKCAYVKKQKQKKNTHTHMHACTENVICPKWHTFKHSINVPRPSRL